MNARSACLVLLAAVALTLPVQPCLAHGWEEGPDSPFQFTRFGGVYFADNGLIYFPGGRLSSGATDGSIWTFDPVTYEFADTGVDLPVPVANYSPQILQDATGKGIYIVGGRDGAGSPIATVQVYYPATNTATQLAGADNWPPAPTRIPGGIVEYGNKLYVFGGYRSAIPAVYSGTWVFDPSRPAGSKWSNLGLGVVLGAARSYIQACVVDGYAYAIGGDILVAGDLTATDRVERLNLADTGAGWSQLASLPGPLGEGRAFGFDAASGNALAGRIIAAGGGKWPVSWAGCYNYSVADDIWTSFPSLHQKRRNPAAVLVPLGGGYTEMWMFGGSRDSDSDLLALSERYLVSADGLDLTMSSLSPAVGEAFTVDVAVQPLTETFDAWGLILAETGDVYSFVLGQPTQLREGAHALATGVHGLPSAFNARLFEIAAMPAGLEGAYEIVVELVPTGLAPIVPIPGYSDAVEVGVH